MSLEERVARLEQRADTAEKMAEIFSSESRLDRIRLHDAIDKLERGIDGLVVTIETRNSRQVGYIAGAASVMSIAIGALVFAWESFVRWIKS